ncbi:root phototropism protein 3-like [Musa acuminata AAA Group]|uniref:root phototropism protein 3-like n=1 Tax=Musa acuminata AAA Group TaxID=214697 RepID=UPI0031D00A76
MISASPPCPSPNRSSGSTPPPPLRVHEDHHHHHPTAGHPRWLDDPCIQELDHFSKTLTGIEAKGDRPELLSSILSHYSSRWLPELSCRAAGDPSPESPTAAWLKKRFFIETLASILPTEKRSVSCDVLLTLLRTASMVGAAASCVRELEARAAAQLDEASLEELMIPAFSHTCGTLLDVGLVLRLVRTFAGNNDDGGAAVRSGAALARVAKLVDLYLAEAALDAGLTVAEFEELANSLPAHARAMDDGLYRAVDTFIKAHPSTSKQERKTLCRLIDARKLSAEASLHAAQNERLPVRSAIQVLFSENTKLHRLTEHWRGSFDGPRSPNPEAAAARCPSKREVLAHQQEIRGLTDDVARLRVHCQGLQAQIDKLASSGKKKRGFFRWSSFLLFRTTDDDAAEDSGRGAGRPMPARASKRSVPQANKWRNSLS